MQGGGGMKHVITKRCENFTSYRAERVKSLFNAERGDTFTIEADLPLDDFDWQIGLIVGASGTGKTTLGGGILGGGRIHNLYAGWDNSKPIVDCIAPEGDFNTVTGALAAVGLGDVPSWLKPFAALSNGQQFRAGLARLVCSDETDIVVDEFTSVIDRQIAKIGSLAFQKSWRRGKRRVVLLSCHYDIVEWLSPDWVYSTDTHKFERRRLRRPDIQLQILKTNSSYWRYFKRHYYLDLPTPVSAEFFVGLVDGELVCHLAVTPFFTANAYRATRLVVMPEWQGAGVGTKFLEWVCEYHAQGNGRCGRKLPTFFHTSHPQLVRYLRGSKLWVQKSASLFGGNKAKSAAAITKAAARRKNGYGGHFRAVQGFKYIGLHNEKHNEKTSAAVAR
jgi:GNAT superfamily N-acetyltransferase